MLTQYSIQHWLSIYVKGFFPHLHRTVQVTHNYSFTHTRIHCRTAAHLLANARALPPRAALPPHARAQVSMPAMHCAEHHQDEEWRAAGTQVHSACAKYEQYVLRDKGLYRKLAEAARRAQGPLQGMGTALGGKGMQDSAAGASSPSPSRSGGSSGEGLAFSSSTADLARILPAPCEPAAGAARLGLHEEPPSAQELLHLAQAGGLHG